MEISNSLDLYSQSYPQSSGSSAPTGLIYNNSASTGLIYNSNTGTLTTSDFPYSFFKAHNAFYEVLLEFIKIRNHKRDVYISNQPDYRNVMVQKEELAVQMKKLLFAKEALDEAEKQIKKEIAEKWDTDNPPSEDLITLKKNAGTLGDNLKLNYE